jgi:hypothetical protein
MMTVIWLIVWLVHHTPSLSPWTWDNWEIALTVCASLDIAGLIFKESR